MLADYHIHSIYSDDSTELMDNIVQKAIDIHLDEICFTDHVDYDIKCDRDVFKSKNKINIKP